MGKIVTFGELLLRLSPEGFLRIIQTEKYNAVYGGAEANVAIALANMGNEVSFVTKLPDNEIGQGGVNTLRKYGVKTDDIVRGGDRVGIYFCEKGAGCRGNKVIYDRANSSIALSNENDFDWNKIFENATWFHFTGITPALGKNVALITEIACIEAKKRNIKVSCDLNYRSKLWSKEDAGNCLDNLMQYVDVFVSNVPQIFDVFGLKADTNEELAKILIKKYSFSQVVFSERVTKSASFNEYSGMIFDGEKFCYSKKYNVEIIDRIGGGDAFCAGLIFGNEKNFDLQKTIDWATAMAALKHTVEGDFVLTNENEILNLAYGDSNVYVQR